MTVAAQDAAKQIVEIREEFRAVELAEAMRGSSVLLEVNKSDTQYTTDRSHWTNISPHRDLDFVVKRTGDEMVPEIKFKRDGKSAQFILQPLFMTYASGFPYGNFILSPENQDRIKRAKENPAKYKEPEHLQEKLVRAAYLWSFSEQGPTQTEPDQDRKACFDWLHNFFIWYMVKGLMHGLWTSTKEVKKIREAFRTKFNALKSANEALAAVLPDVMEFGVNLVSQPTKKVDDEEVPDLSKGRTVMVRHNVMNNFPAYQDYNQQAQLFGYELTDQDRAFLEQQEPDPEARKKIKRTVIPIYEKDTTHPEGQRPIKMADANFRSGDLITTCVTPYDRKQKGNGPMLRVCWFRITKRCTTVAGGGEGRSTAPPADLNDDDEGEVVHENGQGRVEDVTDVPMVEAPEPPKSTKRDREEKKPEKSGKSQKTDKGKKKADEDEEFLP